MRVIELNAKGWNTVLDFYEALKSALGAPYWHGSSIDAFIDSMIYGDINEIEAPYRVRVSGISAVSPELKAEISEFAKYITQARDECRARKCRSRTGTDVEISFETED